MKNEIRFPKTLLEATKLFSNEENAWLFAVNLRWPNGPVCPFCQGKEHSFLSTRKTWQCKLCKKQFSVKKGSIFEDSPLPLEKWLIGMWLICNAKNGISSYELHRSLGITQKSAWFLGHRIRLAMQNGSIEMIGGKNGTPVEVDETFIGANARNMHMDVREAKGVTHGSKDHRATVLGMLERDGRVITFHVADTKSKTLMPLVKKNVKPDSYLYTDAATSYVMAGDHFRHEFVDHATEYVNGLVHTNGMENYWSLLKRTIKGTYVSVEPFHLFRYLDEQAFRYNERKGNDGTRFIVAVSGINGKRVTYKKLIGKETTQAAVRG